VSVTPLAAGVAALSFALALAAAGLMLWLIVRRRQLEGAADRERAGVLTASREMMAALSGNGTVLGEELPREARLGALSQLLRLVRGDDRERLLALAERNGLFEAGLAGLTHRRAARRAQAIRELEYFASAACLAGLARCLAEDGSPRVRLEAAAALARLDALPPVEQLLSSLGLPERPVTRVHAALLRGLAPRDAEAIALLAEREDQTRLRPLLVETLGWTGDFAMARRLAAHAVDREPEVRSAAVRAARHLKHPGASAWIVPLLEDPAAPVRLQAAQACGELEFKAAIPALERLAADPDWWVRTRARTALAILRPGRRRRLKAVEAPA
jgi:HEAT repeat protein